MSRPATILYITEQDSGNSKLLHALLAGGYRVTSLHSLEQTPALVEVSEAKAAVIDSKFTPATALLARKIKFLAPELPVMLVSCDPESNAPPPESVDVVAYVESPAAFVHALTSLLQSIPPQGAVAA